MNEDDKKLLSKDPDGLLTYEYLANNINDIADDIDDIVDNMLNVDATGQFVVSAARYLHAIDPNAYRSAISRLVSGAIEKDRERRYIGGLLTMWGDDYAERADDLSALDDNFRRIYKRVYPSAGM